MGEQMSHDNPQPSQPPPSPRQVLLGLFILFQLAFLIVSNLLGFAKWAPAQLTGEPRQRLNQVLPQLSDEQGHGWQWAEEVETGIRRWVQLTGQDQEWALFTPVGEATGFPAVLFSWEDANPADAGIEGAKFTFDAKTGFHMQIDRDAPRAEILLSENEPKDMSSFFRFNKVRVRRFEGQFYLNLQPSKDEKPDELASRMTRRIQKLTKEYHDFIVAYLRWRLQAWELEHPERPLPKQVILLERFYRIHGPEEPRGWDGPVVYPMARWLPKLKRADHAYILEAFDFTEKRFVVLK